MAAIYTSAHISLAMLEVLVHLDRVEIPEDYVLMGIELGPTPIRDATLETALALSGTRRFPVLQVNSAVISREANYVLYPEAPGLAARIAFDEPFRFDPRLFLPNRSI